MNRFFLEREFRRQIDAIVQREILWDCEDRGFSTADALWLAGEVCDRQWAEETRVPASPAVRMALKLREARAALHRAEETLAGVKRDFELFKRALGEGARSEGRAFAR